MNKIGIIAGNGRFPFLVAEGIRKTGDSVVGVGIKEETDPSFEKLTDKMIWLSLGQLQKLIDFFHEENITTAVMAGQVKHFRIFAALKFDLRTIKLLASLENKKTDSVLGAIASELEKEGVHLMPSHAYLTHLLPQKGLICGKRPGAREQEDIDFGFKTAKQIAGLDIGQTVVVKDKAVIAVESMEGTDECIRRAGKLGRGDITVVKVAKPNQDMRFDIPVIGPNTMKTMAESGARILAVESGSTLMLDKEEMLKTAEKNKITILAI
jgi:DUF1009 family protein